MKKILQEQRIDWSQGNPRPGGGTSGGSGTSGTSNTSGNSSTSGTSNTSGNSGTAGTSTNPENEFDEKIQDLEKKLASIKNSESAKKVKDSWDNLWEKVKDSAADSQTQLKVLLLKQKIDAAARKVTPAGQTMNFIDCTGWNTLGCKSESIKKVQSCMNLGVSGNFDEFLKSELARYKSTYAFREGFNDSDVQKICVFKQEEDRQEALRIEQLAKQAQKAAEIQAFERNYPQKTTKATRRDEF